MKDLYGDTSFIYTFDLPNNLIRYFPYFLKVLRLGVYLLKSVTVEDKTPDLVLEPQPFHHYTYGMLTRPQNLGFMLY